MPSTRTESPGGVVAKRNRYSSTKVAVIVVALVTTYERFWTPASDQDAKWYRVSAATAWFVGTVSGWTVPSGHQNVVGPVTFAPSTVTISPGGEGSTMTRYWVSNTAG